MHAPAAQPLVAFVSAHTRPQPPQFDGSIAVFAQAFMGAAPQVTRGAAQVAPHTPAEHSWPAVQRAPQPPQFALSERVSTSQPSAGLALQSRKPDAHAVIAHAPAAQALVAWASAQVRPQPPQLVALTLRSVSQPSLAVPLQSPKPPPQRTTVQAPAAQPYASAWASAHTRPHPPQCSGLRPVLAQNASAAVPHVVKGEAQVAPHAPPEQTWPAAQRVPQRPQLVLSVRVSASQPLAGAPSQSAKPAAQAAMAQAPAAQLAVALGSAHVRPHAPQLVALVARSVSQPVEARPSQSPKPPTQRTTAHSPPTQPGAATWSSAHARPQPPQCVGSSAVLAQNAVAPAPHVASGAAQVAPHAPPEHT